LVSYETVPEKTCVVVEVTLVEEFEKLEGEVLKHI
jgi:hypothetical protein